jgi:hypothetical protein
MPAKVAILSGFGGKGAIQFVFCKKLNFNELVIFF